MTNTSIELRRLLAPVLLIFALFATTACEKEGPLEKAGKAADEAVEEAGDKIEEATDKVRESTQS